MAAVTPILVINSGSSSLKFGLYEVGLTQTKMLLSGEIEGIGKPNCAIHAVDAGGKALLSESTPVASQQDAVARIARVLTDAGLPSPHAVGHRVVHGGPGLRRHCRIDETVMRQLQDAVPFAPLHIPAALALLRIVLMRFPGLPQVACFDTVFSRRSTGCRTHSSSAQNASCRGHSALWLSWPFLRIDCSATKG
jgi:acetate kinase